MKLLLNYVDANKNKKYHVFHVPEIKKLEEYDKELSTIPNPKLIIEDHVKFGGLSTYLKKTELQKHIYLPDITTKTASSKEELWKYFNLI